MACGDPKKYIAVVGRNATLVLHLPWQHWQFVDTDDVSLGYVDKDATWCVMGYLFGIDPLRETLYLLDPEEAHWTVRQDLPVMNNVNWSTPLGVVNTWVGFDGELILVERFGEYRHVMFTNSSGIAWVVLSEDSNSKPWPDLDKHVRSLAFNLGTDRMWLWIDTDDNVPDLWAFNYNESQWEKASPKFAKTLPPLDLILTAWEEDDKYCILKRSSDCTAQYTASDTMCWTEDEMTANETERDQPMSTIELSTSPTNAAVKSENSPSDANNTSDSGVISSSSSSSTDSPSVSYSNIVPEIATPMKPVVTKYAAKTTWNPTEKNNDMVSIKPARSSFPWHQHTSVFGSVIFFGTSLTIFGLVGFVWCVRKCVHFPKEALLLRDPPSVRYTAIPDSLGYDSRKPTPATYTVIPDSIA